MDTPAQWCDSPHNQIERLARRSVLMSHDEADPDRPAGAGTGYLSPKCRLVAHAYVLATSQTGAIGENEI